MELVCHHSLHDLGSQAYDLLHSLVIRDGEGKPFENKPWISPDQNSVLKSLETTAQIFLFLLFHNQNQFVNWLCF